MAKSPITTAPAAKPRRNIVIFCPEVLVEKKKEKNLYLLTLL